MINWIERMDDRMDAITASLTANLTTRIVKRGLLYFDQHTNAELLQGVVMPVSDGESDYYQVPGLTALSGKHSLLIICHVRVDDTGTTLDIEEAELDLIEDLKAWARTGIPGMDLTNLSFQHSRQLEYPYGWVVLQLQAEPNRSNVYL